MRILYHIPFPVVGGAELQIKYLLKYMPPGVTPIVTYMYQEVESFVKSLGVEHYRAYSPLSLVKVIEAARVDLIQFYHSHDMYGVLKRLRKAPPCVEVLHNRLPFPGDCSSYPKNFTHTCVGVSADAAYNFLQSVSGVRTIVIPNGVDTELFNPSVRGAYKRSYRYVGGFTGRLEQGDGKGIPAILRVAEACPDVDFELVGNDYGGYQQSCHLPNVRFYPHEHDVRPFYAKWDFFISMSPAEGFGLSIAEAYHCGLPSVVFDCGGVTDLLREEVTIVRSEQDAVAAIRGSIRQGPRKVDLSAATMAQRYHALYREVLGASDTSSAQVFTLRPDTSSAQRLAVCPSDWHGVRRSLASFTDAYSDPPNAIAAIKRSRPSVVVFGCYTPLWEKVLQFAKACGCKTVLTWHASYILNEFDHINREWMFHALKAHRAGLFDHITTPHEGLATTWTHFGYKTDFLPNLVDNIPDASEKAPGLNIGIFGSGQPWKNVECQVIAASMIDGAKVHTQKIKHRQSLESLGIVTKDLAHVDSDLEYMRLLSSMKVNLCCSLSETYSFFTIESFMCGTPLVGTPIIPLFKKAPPELKPCICPYFEDPIAIKDSIEAVLADYDTIRKVGREYMIELNEKNKLIAKSVTDRW